MAEILQHSLQQLFYEQTLHRKLKLPLRNTEIHPTWTHAFQTKNITSDPKAIT
jgi:hypothetical protein